MRRHPGPPCIQMTERRLHGMLHCWRQHVATKQRLHGLLMRMLDLRLARALGSWREAAAHRARCRDVVARAAARLQQRSLAAALAWWREWAGEVQHLRERGHMVRWVLDEGEGGQGGDKEWRE